jgi:beta-mannosidase
MDLEGQWLAAPSDDQLRRLLAGPDLDDSGWDTITVPGHWRSHPAFAASDGPIIYRRHFSAPAPAPGRRTFLIFDGIFYMGDVWLDGEYLGDTEGYFFPHAFEVTAAFAARPDHDLSVEVACPRPQDLTAKRNLTGVFQHWDCIDPDWNPGGIWAPVRTVETGAIRIRSLKVLCRDATEDTASLDIEAELDRGTPAVATVTTTARREGSDSIAAERREEHALAEGSNVVRWRLAIERPDLWWPHALGDQPLYEIDVAVETGSGEVSDGCVLRTGLRRIRVRNFVATVNGERLFLKGANYGPTCRALAEATPQEVDRDVTLARQAGLDLLRVHAHVARPEFYEAADRQGLLVWQDLPLQWGYGQVRRQAVAQARRAVSSLGHHPSIALWCGHNEPISLEVTPSTLLTPKVIARQLAGHVLPSWNKTGLDRSIRRALERADGSREVVAHSGILPHPAWGTDSHLYFGWYHGEDGDLAGTLARLPILARFVSEFGAQAVPDDAGFMHPERWPDLAWDELEAHHCLQRAIFEQRIPPSRYQTFEEWRAATQRYQAELLRHHIETLRRLKYRPTGGFCLFLLADSQPAVTWSILDHQRNPKEAYQAVTDACAPVIITADRPAASYQPGRRLTLNVHVVSDLRRPLLGAIAEARLSWPGGERVWRFAGDVPADSCVRIGRLDQVLEPSRGEGPIRIDLTLQWGEGTTTNSYLSRVSW